MTTPNAPTAAAPNARDEPPTVLFYTETNEVAEVYLAHLPEGWRLETLRSRDDENEKLDRLRRADVLIHTDVPLTAEQLAVADRLRLIHRQGVGVDAVDLEAAEARGIAVCICPVGTPETVAEHAIMLMMAVGRHLVTLHREVAAGGWPKWEYRNHSMGLSGATVGLVGFGRIGQATASRLLPFGVRLLISRRDARPLDAAWEHERIEAVADLDELFGRSDVVSLHCPLTPDTTGLVDHRRLALMPAHAILINTARGGLVVEEDLVEALRERRIAGAGLDVTNEEPPAPDNPLRTLPNALVTPHLAAGTRNTQHAKAAAVMDNAVAVMSGRTPRFRVR